MTSFRNVCIYRIDNRRFRRCAARNDGNRCDLSIFSERYKISRTDLNLTFSRVVELPSPSTFRWSREFLSLVIITNGVRFLAIEEQFVYPYRTELRDTVDIGGWLCSEALGGLPQGPWLRASFALFQSAHEDVE